VTYESVHTYCGGLQSNVLQSVLQCVVALQRVAELLQCVVVCVAECGSVS